MCGFALVLLTVLALPGRAVAAPTTGTAAARSAAGPAPALVLLSQTSWVTPGQQFDLHLRTTAPSVPAGDLGLTVAVYSCLSSVSGFDQSLVGSPTGTPVSSTTSPLSVASLDTVAGGGVNLAMPVVVGEDSAPSTSAAPFTIQLRAVGGQCQSFPSGVFPVHVQLIDTRNDAVVDTLTTHLIYTQAPADTQRLRVGVVLPIQATQPASHDPSPTELLARPSSALASPSPATISAVSGTVSTIATAHPTVPVTLQVSGQTVDFLSSSGHQSTLSQLAQLASTPDVHQLTAAPFTPIDASALVGSGLGTELSLQVARGLEVVDAATDRPAPSPATGLGPWITGDALDPSTVGALSTDGFREVVLPTDDLSSTPAVGSTTEPFPLTGSHGATVTAMGSDDDLSARFVSDPGDPVLAAHQLVAELAQLYYERPNGTSPRAVLAVAPPSWTDYPAFVDALLGSLDGNPMIQASTMSQIFALFPAPAACRSGCRLTGGGGTGGVPVSAIRVQRIRVNGFATSAVGMHTLAQQLGDLVLGGEAQTLRPSQQSAVVANAGAAVDAQVGQVAVEGDLTITLTASSGTIPVTVVSDASYPVSAQLVLGSDKLLFPNGETQWSKPVLLDPGRSNVIYVKVRTRASGMFRLDVSLRSPDGTLRLASGELSVRSTSSSVVGVVLTAGAVVVLAVWWVRTSRRRKARARADEAADAVREAGSRSPDDGGPEAIESVPGQDRTP